MTAIPAGAIVRTTRRADFEGIIEMCREVYPDSPPWRLDQLESHLRVFPEGQFVAVEAGSGRVVGMAASLIIKWDHYRRTANWRDFTDRGFFTNHAPVHGRTLYGAEVMVRRATQGAGIGTKLYAARRQLVEQLSLRRIRAGARLRRFGRHADRMTAEEYVVRVIRGDLRDPTLSFQLRRGFRVIGVVSEYLPHDPASLGYAAIIEWLNPKVATPEDYARQPGRFRPLRPTAG